METIAYFLIKEGIGDKQAHKAWFQTGALSLNGQKVDENASLHLGDTLNVRGKDYHIVKTDEPGRLGYQTDTVHPVTTIPGKIQVHCGYHKCLTMFFRRLSEKTVRFESPISGRFRHFYHRLDEFYHDCESYTLSSISGHCLDLDRFDDIRVVNIIRDPRDLLISGYFYHKRAVEGWCNYLNPTDTDWAVVNGIVPKDLPKDLSFADYLHQVPEEQGLMAELDFRHNHFKTMMDWPQDDPRVLTIRYEDIMGNETETLRKIYRFYGFSLPTQLAAGFYANRYSAKSERRRKTHIRNAKFGQWKNHFTPALADAFQQRYGDLLHKYDYEHQALD